MPVNVCEHKKNMLTFDKKKKKCMEKRNSYYIKLSAIVLLINLFIDRITKILAVQFLEGKETVSFFYNTIVLKYVENSGAFLSAGSEWSDGKKYLFLVALPLIACFYGLYYTTSKVKNTRLVIIIVTIIGGGLGNLIDRVFNDFHVVDFLNFGIGPIRTGILNVADMSVTFGVIYLLYIQFIKKEKTTPVT